MKFFIILGLIVSVSAVPYHYGVVNTGSSAVQRSDDGYGNYAFGYNEDHATGGTFRKEKGGPGVKVGSYGLRDADGRVRIVNYVADAHGFRATVSTNEPGTDPKQDPAATSLTYGHAYSPVSLAPAPSIAYVPSYGTPIYTKTILAPMHTAYSVSHASYLPLKSHYIAEPLLHSHSHYSYRHY